MRTVSRLTIAPVKSMALVFPDRIDLRRWGTVGNRVFCWVDPAGRLIGGAQQGTLVQVKACHYAEKETLTLSFPLESFTAKALAVDSGGTRIDMPPTLGSAPAPEVWSV